MKSFPFEFIGVIQLKNKGTPPSRLPENCLSVQAKRGCILYLHEKNVKQNNSMVFKL